MLEEALRSPHYREYLKQTGRLALQFGYSDSGRYVGQLAASYLIERLRLKIGQTLEHHGVTGVEVIPLSDLRRPRVDVTLRISGFFRDAFPTQIALFHEAVQAAKGAGKWVGMCGEMASDPLCTLALLGLGLDDLSMGPFFIPVIKRIVRSVSYAAARSIARDVLTMGTVKEVKGHLFDGMKSLGIIELMEMYH